MIDIEKLARDGFKIIDGVLCYRDRTLIPGLIRVNEFYNDQYHFDDYSLNDYKIEKAVQYDEWYLKKGTQEICHLRYLGGKNWETL